MIVCSAVCYSDRTHSVSSAHQLPDSTDHILCDTVFRSSGVRVLMVKIVGTGVGTEVGKHICSPVDRIFGIVDCT
jgi:hypothetical protein